MEGVELTNLLSKYNNPLQASNASSEERGVTSSRDDGNKKELPKKRKNVKRGKKTAIKDKPPAQDNEQLSTNYLPDGSSQTFRTHRCPKCHRCFKMRSHLQEHLHLHFPDPSLQCPTCKRYFTSKSKLRVHQLREAGLKTHQCHLCEYSAVERNSLRRHLVTVHADEMEDSVELNYPCPVCNESFRQSKSLKIHMKTHNVVQDTKQFSCIKEGCSFQSNLRKNLLQHVNEAHGFTPIECRHHACSAIFQTKILMETHYRTHLAYHCADCDFSCSNKRLFVQHQKQGHEGRDQLLCEFCDFKTFNPVEFEQHVGHLHANEKIHRCSQCSYVTAHKRGLKRHLLTHSGEKPFKCSKCEFRCRDESYLSRHMLTHSDLKNYMCSECGYVTKWKHYLNVHMRKHAGDLRYHCDQCSYRCHRMDQLNSHKLRHQEKSLICEICAYSCKRKYELRNHMIAKHSGANNKQATVYKCKYCTYTTSYRQAVQNHENCKHTKLKEFNCALCSYSSFSNISLFLHKRKTHGYIPGDKAWLHNYALKEKEKTTIRTLDEFYNATSKEPIAANAKQSSYLDASENNATKVNSISDLDVVSQEVVNEDALASPSEEYCTLVLTTLSSNDYQTSNLQNSCENLIDVAVGSDLMPKNACLSSEEDGETAMDSGQNYFYDTSQIGDTAEVGNKTSRANFEVKDLKQLDKKQAESMVLDGHVKMLMVPTQNANSYVKKKTLKIKSLRGRQKYSCQKCGAEFKQRQSLDRHIKKNCLDNANSREVVASSSNIDNRSLDNHFNLQNEQKSTQETTSSSYNLVSISKSPQYSNNQSLEANGANVNSATLHEDSLYAQNGGKFECNQCGFSSVRLATMERHISTCSKKSTKKDTLKTVKENRILFCSSCSFTCREESALERHAKSECQKSKDLRCSDCEFVAKSKLSLIRHKVREHNKKSTHFNCERCTFRCKQKRHLLQHVAVKHKGTKPFQCHYCKFSTTRHYRLEEHESIHTGIGRHECEICHKTFGALSKLRQHKQRLHDKMHSHFCPQCDFSGFSQDDVRRHNRRCHSGELNFNCGQCEARFGSVIALRNHCKRAHQGSLECKQSNFVSANEAELSVHQNSKHNVVKQPNCEGKVSTQDNRKSHHNCQLCQFSTKTKKLLAQHLLQEHEEGPSENKALRCSQCEFTCQYPLVLEQHLRSHGGKRVYKCTQCEYATRNKQKMTWHIRIHTGERPYSCELCKYTCTDPSRLKLHMRVHEEEKKYLCPECGYKCKWATQLKYHMTKHTGEKRYTCPDCDYRTNRADALRSHRDTQHCSSRPFICEQCGKSFKTSFILKSHQQQHSDSRPYACGLCQKAFKWPAGLRHHFLSHTKQQPFSCRICGYRAKQRFQVVKHLRRHHPDVRVEEGVERDAAAGSLTLREALEGRTLQEKRLK